MVFSTKKFNPVTSVGASYSGAVNGSNLSFTLDNSASSVVVYADGLRVTGGGDDYTFDGTTGVTFEAGRQPFSTLVIDAVPS